MLLNTKKFIERSKNVHGNKYHYDKSIFVNSSTKIIITCPLHGDFTSLPYNHYGKKCGCPVCSYKKLSIDRLYSNEDIIANFKYIHHNTYDYSKVKYINSRTNIEIICRTHGSFWQSPGSHKNGYGFPKCGFKSLRK
jgi:hypothetical protein